MKYKVKLDSKRNCRKIKCSRCKKNILFNKEDIYEGDNDEKFVRCEICGHENRLKKLK